MQPLRHRRGFTLMELLIVVAVIAILVAVLIPAIGRSKKQSIRAVCLGNLRQTYLPINSYAVSYQGVTPVGAWGNKQYNYPVLFPKTSNTPIARPSAYGLIHYAGMIESPKAFFCPVFADAETYFDSNINPWRPYPFPNPDPFDAVLGGRSGRTSLGYGMRPLANWVPMNHSGFPDHQITYVPIPNFGPTTVNYPAANQVWPKLPNYQSKALLSDITPHAAALKARHGDGVNVLFGHGGAAWVPLAAFKNTLIGPDPNLYPSTSLDDPKTAFGTTSPTNFNAFDLKMLDESTNPPTGLWADFDSYQ